MQAVNKKMDPQKTLQTMQNFQKENMKMEMTEEMSKTFFFFFFLALLHIFARLHNGDLVHQYYFIFGSSRASVSCIYKCVYQLIINMMVIPLSCEISLYSPPMKFLFVLFFSTDFKMKMSLI